MNLARRMQRGALLSLAALLLLLNVQAAAQTAAPEEQAVREMDELLSKAYPPNEPGAAVIVVKDGKTILRKGYGMADVELGVKVEPDMVFRLGSITKQFTAAAVLMLAEQGKLSLTDDMTKFFPDYPAKGRVVTVEHLLTHTSGIKSYTSLSAWRALWRKDVTVAELIDIFKNEPADFGPGEQWSYNNSGYILLGAIIEKVSGTTYEQFLQKNIFEPLGMKNTYYDRASRIIPRRVAGYTMSKEGLRNAEYLSMTHPYAAGALLSTVDDMALWDAALYGEKLLKQSSLQRAFTPYVLKDGTATHYGYGWTRFEYGGRPVIEHGGSIHGFRASGIRFPEDRIYVSILSNRDWQSLDYTALRLAALAAGRPLRPAVAVTVGTADLEPLVGVYQINPKETYTVRRDGARLTIQRSGTRANEVFPVSPTQFFYEKDSLDRLTFERDAAGKVTGLRVTRAFGPLTVAARTDKPLPKERAEVKLAPEVLERYVGVYEVSAGRTITVTRKGGQLFAQPSGQPEMELLAEAEGKFFIKAVDVQLDFQTDAAGQVTGLIMHQGARDFPAKKVK